MGLMDNNKIKEMLPDYVQGLLSEEDSLAVKEQLEKSEPLRKEYEELRSYYHAIGTLKPVKAPHNFLDKIHSRIEAPSPLAQVLKKLFYPFHIKIPIELAGVVLTAVLLILIYNPFSSKKIPPVDFDKLSMQSKEPAIDEKTAEETEEPEKPAVVEEDVAEVRKKVKEKEVVPVGTTQGAAEISKAPKKPAIKPVEKFREKPKKQPYTMKKELSPASPEESSKDIPKSTDLLKKGKLSGVEGEISHLEETAPEPTGGIETEKRQSVEEDASGSVELLEKEGEIAYQMKSEAPEREMALKDDDYKPAEKRSTDEAKKKKELRRRISELKKRKAETPKIMRQEAASKKPEAERSTLTSTRKDQEEIYAERLIDKSDSIVLIKKQVKPELVDLGLLTLSITKKEEKAPKAEVSLSQEDRLLSAKEAAPEVELDIKPESESELIFAQVQSIIKEFNGKFTLLEDKPQEPDKKYYLVEKIHSIDLPYLIARLKKEGVVTEKNFSFDTSKDYLVKFKLNVSIE